MTLDNEDDIAYECLITILDRPLKMGIIPKLKEDFNKKRRQILKIGISSNASLDLTDR